MPDKQEKPKTLAERLELPVKVLGLIATAVGLFFTFNGLPTQWRQSQEAKVYGACALKPQSPASIKRLNGYIAEGTRYASYGSYKLAAHAFQQVIDVDPNFLGAHQNLGVIQEDFGDFNKAQDSLDSEIKLIDCLRSVPQNDLYRFAYMLKVKTDHHAADSIYMDRLNAAEDSAHYNLACLYSKENESAAAIDELKKAAEHHSIDRAVVAHDSDLRAVHQDAAFQGALGLF